MASKKLPVIIVDESKMAHYGYRGMLAKNQFLKIKACTASPGKALEVLKKIKKAVVVVDTLVTGTDPEKWPSFIKEQCQDTVIILSSYVFDYSCWQHVKNKTVHGYVLKTCSARDLVEAAMAGLQKKPYLSKAVSDIVALEITAEEDKYEKAGFQFTGRENEVVYWMLRGKTVKFIADKIHLSPDTISGYCTSILKKTKTETTGELIILFIKKRIITEAEILKWKG